MKSVKINGVSARAFEKRELSEKLRLSDEEIKLVMDYQQTFPELLQDGVEGFVIDSENLWNQLSQPQGRYNDWLRRKIKENYEENKDWTFTQSCVKGGRPKQVVSLTLETAKQVSMFTGVDKNSSDKVRNKGKLIRTYFITMEKTLRKYEKWTEIREPQKAGNNEMKEIINDEYMKSHNTDSSPFYIFCNENDMLNIALLGKKAKEVKELLDYEDKMTREHFTSDINKALSELQMINSSLVVSNMDFDSRKSIIQNTCNIKYSHIKK
jgi:phage anti-repressor protein